MKSWLQVRLIKNQVRSLFGYYYFEKQRTRNVAPFSGIENLKLIPGIYVNDANGEVGNEIQGRGLSTRYFSIQEDGLPSSVSEFASAGTFARDMFLRTDLMDSRLEAVRGGSGSITATNAPGGIFNYITRTGGDKTEIEVRTKTGLQANGEELYSKTELFVGGQFKKTWQYAVGGFYRYDGGNRPTLFPFSSGGLIRANLFKTFKSDGYIKIYGKWLNDRVGLNRPIFASNWDHIQPAPGFNWDDNLILPDVAFTTIDGFNTKSPTQPVYTQIKMRDQQKMSDIYLGTKVVYSISDKWKLSNNIKYSVKNISTNTPDEGSFALRGVGQDSVLGVGQNLHDQNFLSLYANFLWNSLGGPISPTSIWRPMYEGRVQFYDINTQDVLAEYDYATENTTFNHLPHKSVLVAQVTSRNLSIHEIINQFSASGKILENLMLTSGFYIHFAKNESIDNSSTTFLTPEKHPRVIGTKVIMPKFSTIDLPHLVPLSGKTAYYSDPTGAHGYNDFFNGYRTLNEGVYSGFVNVEWEPLRNLNVDIGLRYENIHHFGKTGLPHTPTNKDFNENPGGADGDITTVFDNAFRYFSGKWLPVDIHYNTFSFSGGVNYKIKRNIATYVRVSSSQKLFETEYNTSFSLIKDSVAKPFIPRRVTQFELGYRINKPLYSLFAVSYASFEQNVFYQNFIITTQSNQGFYRTNPLYNNILSYGVEVEFMLRFSRKLAINTIFNLSGSYFTDYKIWDLGATDKPEDDLEKDISGTFATGKILDFSPIDVSAYLRLMKEKLHIVFNFRRYAQRYANFNKAFSLDGFFILKIGASYKLSKQITASVNVNNLFNELGILRYLGYNQIGGFSENTTQKLVQENPNLWFKVQRSLPRALYFTLHYTL